MRHAEKVGEEVGTVGDIVGFGVVGGLVTGDRVGGSGVGERVSNKALISQL